MKKIKPRSCKSKGARFQKEVKQLLHKYYPELENDDIKVAIMGEHGLDIHFSPTARQFIPISVECKNVEKLNIWSALEQTESNVKENTYPVLFFRRNRTKPYVALKAEDFLKLIK